MSAPLIIIDRDGVINYDSDDYIKSAQEWRAINSSLIAISRLTKAGYKIAIASNQSGLARGLFNVETLQEIHNKMLSVIRSNGGHISAIEFCPDHPDNPGPNRKPAPGMILSLLKQFKVNAEDTWFVGDTLSDIQCALNSGCMPALVLTGKGAITQQSALFDVNTPVFKDLNTFTDRLLA